MEITKIIALQKPLYSRQQSLTFRHIDSQFFCSDGWCGRGSAETSDRPGTLGSISHNQGSPCKSRFSVAKRLGFLAGFVDTLRNGQEMEFWDLRILSRGVELSHTTVMLFGEDRFQLRYYFHGILSEVCVTSSYVGG